MSLEIAKRFPGRFQRLPGREGCWKSPVRGSCLEISSSFEGADCLGLKQQAAVDHDYGCIYPCRSGGRLIG